MWLFLSQNQLWIHYNIILNNFIRTSYDKLKHKKTNTQQNQWSPTHEQTTLMNRFFTESIKKTSWVWINHTTQWRVSWRIKPTKTTTKGIRTRHFCCFLSELSYAGVHVALNDFIRTSYDKVRHCEAAHSREERYFGN